MVDAKELGVGERSFARTVAVALVLVGCTPAREQPEKAANLTQEIYDGASDTGDDVREVVQIVVGTLGAGTGVLIAPDVVITAGHVLDPFVRQCGYLSPEDYTYTQPATIGGTPTTNTITVRVGHAGNEDLTNLTNTSVIEVSASRRTSITCSAFPRIAAAGRRVRAPPVAVLSCRPT